MIIGKLSNIYLKPDDALIQIAHVAGNRSLESCHSGGRPKVIKLNNWILLWRHQFDAGITATIVQALVLREGVFKNG